MSQTDIEKEVTQMIGWIYESYNDAKPHIKKGFDRDVRHPELTNQLLEILHRPDKAVVNLAVTGSKGKGTHAILVAAILQQIGLCVGLFTSPHLVDFRERFRIDGQMISNQEFLEVTQRVRKETEGITLPPDQYFGPVGLLAIAASLWFQSKQTDVNVYELGRGALHDDVNRIQHQGVIMTPVFNEHSAQLGPTLHDIYLEKLGAITDETDFVVSAQQSDPLMDELLQGATVEKRLVRYPENITFQEEHSGQAIIVNVSVPGSGLDKCVVRVFIPSVLQIYVKNLAVCVHAAHEAWKLIRGKEEAFPDEIHLEGLQLPGRMQIVDADMLTLVDGCIHRENATLVRQWINLQSSQLPGKGEKYGAILGLPADKDGRGVIDELKAQLEYVIFTHATNPHLNFSENWENYAKQYMRAVYTVPGLEEAIKLSNRLKIECGTRGTLILGTQSFVGDVLRHFSVASENIWEEVK